HRRVIRTTNLLERLFLEERRRTKIIPHAFGERPVLKLMYAAVIRAAERWRGIQVGEFEQRQLRAIRDELNRAHAQRVAPAVSRPAEAAKMNRRGVERGRRSGVRIDDLDPGRYLSTPEPSASRLGFPATLGLDHPQDRQQH